MINFMEKLKKNLNEQQDQSLMRFTKKVNRRYMVGTLAGNS